MTPRDKGQNRIEERDAAIDRWGGNGKHRQEADVKSLATNAVAVATEEKIVFVGNLAN